MEDGRYITDDFHKMVEQICRRHSAPQRGLTHMTLLSALHITQATDKETALDIIDTLAEGLKILRQKVEDIGS